MIAIYLEKYLNIENVDAVEYQRELFECLLKSISLNNLKINVFNKDIKMYKPKYCYELIVCNPPYRQENTGRTSLNDIERYAKFGSFLTVEDIFRFSHKYLQNKGLLYISYDVDLLANVISISRNYNLELKRLKFFYADSKSNAKLAFMEFRKNVGAWLTVEPPIFQRVDGKLTDDFKNIFKVT